MQQLETLQSFTLKLLPYSSGARFMPVHVIASIFRVRRHGDYKWQYFHAEVQENGILCRPIVD
jgi:hypothetical protein